MGTNSARITTVDFCTTVDFLESGKETTPETQCESVYLGPDMGSVNIMKYNDVDGSCSIDINELGNVCSGPMFQTCLDFLESSEQCESVYLGPDMGYVKL